MVGSTMGPRGFHLGSMLMMLCPWYLPTNNHESETNDPLSKVNIVASSESARSVFEDAAVCAKKTFEKVTVAGCSKNQMQVSSVAP